MTLTILVCDAERVAILVDDGDRGVGLAKVDTEDGRVGGGAGRGQLRSLVEFARV